MQMVMCDKCGKPIDHMDKFILCSNPRGIIHADCISPKAPTDRRGKVLPAFVYESPQKNAV